MANKPLTYDLDGTDKITGVIMTLLNQFPGLADGEEITFSTLSEESGISVYPVSGAVVENETSDITDHVTQICLYPFFLIYRQSGLNQNRRANTKEWLDNIGKWLERQTIKIDDEEHRLMKYPALSGDRKILSISRQTPSYLDNKSDDQVEDWVVSIAVRYQHEFDR